MAQARMPFNVRGFVTDGSKADPGGDLLLEVGIE